MAKQSGHIFITGTLDDITYYKIDGVYYARMKSTLSRKKVLTSPRFALTRKHASQLAAASKIASMLYRQTRKEKRNVQIFRTLVGKAKVLLAQGKDKEEVMQILKNELFPQEKKAAPKPISKKRAEERVYVTKAGKLVWKNCDRRENRRMSLKNYFTKERKKGLESKLNCIYNE